MAATSALLKSASNIRSQLATYQDELQAFEYSNSAYTDTAFNSYQDYLNKRIDEESKSGSISGASKTLSLTKALDTAGKSNISASITRENIQMLSGNASLTDKYNVIVDQYSRAAANGDMTLAQSLMSQAYSTSQAIQVQNQQAADAQLTLSKAAETAGKQAASDQKSIADHLDESLKQLNTDIKTVGTGGFDKTVKAWTEANKATLETLGVKLPNQPNYWDVVQGVAGAKYNHYMLASQMYAPYGSGPGSESWNNAMSANAVNSGEAKLPTLAGSLGIQDIQQAAEDPSRFVYNPSQGKFVQTQQIGNHMHFDPNANKQVTEAGPQTQGTYSGSITKTVVLPVNQVTQMNKLGLEFSSSVNKDGSVGNGVQVKATDKTPIWLTQVIGKGGVTNIYGGQGSDLSFTSDAKDGTGLAVYHIVSDAGGHQGIYYEGKTSQGYLHGEYGFNPDMTKTPTSSKGFFGRVGDALHAGASNLTGMVMGHASADGLLQSGTHFAPPPIPIAAPAPLPQISLAPPPPLPSVVAAAPVANTQSVMPQTVSVQGNNNAKVQGGVGQSINQSSGKGVAITGTTNAPVGMRI